MAAVKRARLLFLVNGQSEGAMGIRARSLAERLSDEFEIRISYRSASKTRAIAEFLWLLIRSRPALCYVFDMGFSGVLAAGIYRPLARCRVIVDTGDAIHELSRLSGSRGALGLWLTGLLEWFALSISHRVVVRSHFHATWLEQRGIRAAVIQDGVDCAQFQPRQDIELRRHYQLEGVTTIGLLGSLIWNSRWQMCYGWELIEVIDRLRDLPVKGLIVGDGSGLAYLKAQCEARGLEDRILFLGRIPYNELPSVLNLMDICLSTQTNDLAGQVRTTGKLPLYLACGRFVLASEVGEASRVLPPEMLVPYRGTKDVDYPARLSDRSLSLLKHPEQLQQSEVCVAIAKTEFDYDVLSAKLRRVIREALT
jgi:glycosyltransferase involved in cell wall biosynthesis